MTALTRRVLPCAPHAGRLYRIVLPYATFGLVTDDAVVRRAAPIARWTEGRALVMVLAYYRRRGAQIEQVSA